MAPFYGWGSKAESTLEPPSGFEHGTPGKHWELSKHWELAGG